MHQPVLVHTDVDKGAKGGDVGDYAVQDHARTQIRDFFDALREGGGFEGGARIPSGFAQFGNDVQDRRQPHRVIHERGRIHVLQRSTG